MSDNRIGSVEVIDLGDEMLIQWCNKKTIEVFGGTLVDRPITDIVPEEESRVESEC